MKRVRLTLLAMMSAASLFSQTTHVRLTYYHPVRSQCDENPLVTADGSRVNMAHLKAGKLKWCAVSRDLLYLFPKDKPRKIHIEGHGVYEVRDVMNPRMKHRVDILLHPSSKTVIDGNKVKIRIIR